MENNRRLFLTLCKKGSTSYQYAIIPFPSSYNIAVEAAKKAFPETIDPYISIILKFGMKRANGSGTWATLRPEDWGRVVRSDDEIGVLIGLDLIYGQVPVEMPYEPEARNNRG
ncbi:hypothetical protein CPB83DRAFT_851679 [Crepidotus variabilis]|uniref:Uncharacterized protein n=1 Tax=Crepidotus variabilis TaxID=179855 RepID=A0A9P6EIS6_9AGAR|nr:hypothetical protein CPB83DRAFT_851679 [Crepidotus variabilis]